jgi:hypothetical protein
LVDVVFVFVIAIAIAIAIVTFVKVSNPPFLPSILAVTDTTL